MKIQKYASKAIAERLSKLGGLRALEKATGRPLERTSPPQIVHMLIDCSGSMAGEKLEQAKAGAKQFAQEAQGQGHRVGLIAFGSEATLKSNPIYDHEVLAACIATLAVSGSTNLTAAIQLALEALSLLPGERVIYVITDGMPDDSSSALAAADKAKRHGIKIMTLGTDDADREFLAKLASSSRHAVKVESKALKAGVVSMIKLLGN